ncbi:MAG: Ig-like domain-containing protein [Candidatus Eremiobacteraeota bacterium]|nr:Ig-like domain-containing protein [Candidatus Eremiobacteraeota bacterium]
MLKCKGYGRTGFIALLLMAVLMAGCGGGSGSSAGYYYVGTGSNTSPDSPTVTFTDPAQGDTGVGINRKIAATFSKEMNASTINTTTFTVTGPGTTAVSGTVTYVGMVATFTPASSLAVNTAYTATITTGAKDTAGTALAANFTWTFTTGSSIDTTAPTVTFTAPAQGDTGVPINRKIAATFSKAMDPTTISSTTFSVTGPNAAPVSGTVTYVGLVATFTPASSLAVNTVYTATITTGARDLAGNALAANYTWTFTTGSSADTTAPTVTFTAPAQGETGVALNRKIAATFSKAMDPLTITNLTFTLKQGATPVTGTVTYVGLVATFTPVSNLVAGTSYTATITTGAKDLAGNALAANYTWTFTTGSSTDATAPTVTFTAPAQGDTGVVINTKIAATFSKAMDPLTITNLTFTLKQGATPVTGTVTYVGLVATFKPDSNLAVSTTYTATITTGAKDLAGNALAANYSWTFTTGASTDVTAPTVTFTSPAQGDTGVATNKKIAATFSEVMDPATITNLTYTLSQGGAPVSGQATYVGLIATFTPDSNLAANTLYTATVTTGAKDLAGNALATNYTWTFTTGAAPDTTPPTVILVSPSNAEIDVAINKKINATFSEEMDPLTITNLNFTVKDSAGTSVVGLAVTYDLITKIATFTPASNLAPNTTYTATITTGVQDLAHNAMAADYTWTFTTGTRTVPVAPPLGAMAPFGSFGSGAGLTNEGLLTVINGDIGTTGVATKITGLHDKTGANYTVTDLNNGYVNGTIYFGTGDPAAAGAAATQTAFTTLANLAGGVAVAGDQLGGKTLPPGIYKAAAGFLMTEGDLTLDGRGDADAVWVFQMGTTLTVGASGAPRSIKLINGAKAKNIFWQVGTRAYLNPGGGGTLEGTIIAGTAINFSTAGSVNIVTLNGRAMTLTESVTMVNTIINIPLP